VRIARGSPPRRKPGANYGLPCHWYSLWMRINGHGPWHMCEKAVKPLFQEGKRWSLESMILTLRIRLEFCWYASDTKHISSYIHHIMFNMASTMCPLFGANQQNFVQKVNHKSNRAHLPLCRFQSSIVALVLVATHIDCLLT
jgi:hypothetical protein